MRKAILVSLIIVATQFAAAFILYPTLPDRVAIHWNINGEADGYGSKFIGLYLIPIAQLLLVPFFLALPGLDPKHGIERFRETYDWFILGFVAFTAYINSLGIAWNLGYKFNFTYLLAPILGVTFYELGDLLNRAKMNWFVGIRTPWTLSSEAVWNKTHRLGGTLLKICGVISFIGLFFGGWIDFVLAMGSVFVSTITLIIYSYLEYQKEEKKVET